MQVGVQQAGIHVGVGGEVRGEPARLVEEPAWQQVEGRRLGELPRRIRRERGRLRERRRAQLGEEVAENPAGLLDRD